MSLKLEPTEYSAAQSDIWQLALKASYKITTVYKTCSESVIEYVTLA